MNKLVLIFITLLTIGAVYEAFQFYHPQAASGTVIQTPEPRATPAPTFAIPEPSTVYVEIKGLAFDPPELKVIKGTTVKWTNYDTGQHAIHVDNVTSQPFDKRGTWSYRFNRIGVYEYNCTVHPWMKHGRIIVE
jgi:plastocyanin